MRLIVFASSAYEAGRHVGTVVRWIVLAVVGCGLIAYLRAGRFGSRLRSQGAAVAGLAVVAALLLASALNDFGGRDDADGVTAWGTQMVAGCVAAGSPRSVCHCVWDEIRYAG